MHAGQRQIRDDWALVKKRAARRIGSSIQFQDSRLNDGVI